VTATASTTTTAASVIGRRIEVVKVDGLSRPSGEGECGEQAANLLAMTLHAYNIVGMLVIDQQFKFCFAS